MGHFGRGGLLDAGSELVTSGQKRKNREVIVFQCDRRKWSIWNCHPFFCLSVEVSLHVERLDERGQDDEFTPFIRCEVALAALVSAAGPTWALARLGRGSRR